MSNILFRREYINYNSTEYQSFCDINKIHEEKNKPFTVFSIEHYKEHPIFEYLNSYGDEETFKNNIKNQLFSLHSTKCVIVVEEKEEKVSFKFFFSFFEKKVGKPWFKVNKHIDYLTVNRKTGDVYFGYIHNYQKKRKFSKAVRKNYFLGDPLSSLASKIKNFSQNLIPNASEVSNEASNIFIESIIKTDNNLKREDKLFKFYLDRKGFKYPNNFSLFKNFQWSKEFKKILKKNGKKLVDSLMILHGIHGKKIKKYLHESTQLNIENYKVALKLFDEEWLTQNEGAILKLLNYEQNLSVNIFELREQLSKEELKKVFKMIMNFVCTNEIDNWTFTDHARMYLELKQYGETDIKWLTDGQDYTKFSQEHLDWTEKLEHYKRGTYEREYPSYLVEKIETQIDEYYPLVLKNSYDYNSESLVQSNCVKTYIGRPGSLIVSLRKGSIDSNERITVEYWVTYLKSSDMIFPDRIQTLGRYNKGIDESWNDILLKLDETVLLCHKDQNFESVKIKKECSNGVVMKSDSHFDEEGNLRWSHKKENFGTYIW